MASLIIGGAVLLSNKIKEKKQKKRDAKQDTYEKRYKELEEDHRSMSRSDTNATLEKSPEMSSPQSAQLSFDAQRPQIRRASHESDRSHRQDEDGPAQWVDHGK
ncbi:hypothetical protein LTR66_017605, partial [Elasticomyces elasticus]